MNLFNTAHALCFDDKKIHEIYITSLVKKAFMKEAIRAFKDFYCDGEKFDSGKFLNNKIEALHTRWGYAVECHRKFRFGEAYVFIHLLLKQQVYAFSLEHEALEYSNPLYLHLKLLYIKITKH